MALYESVPQIMEAVQWTGRNLSELGNHHLGGKVRSAVGVRSLELLAGRDGAQGWADTPSPQPEAPPHGQPVASRW